jgi:hypothetical protein
MWYNASMLLGAIASFGLVGRLFRRLTESASWPNNIQLHPGSQGPGVSFSVAASSPPTCCHPGLPLCVPLTGVLPFCGPSSLCCQDTPQPGALVIRFFLGRPGPYLTTLSVSLPNNRQSSHPLLAPSRCCSQRRREPFRASCRRSPTPLMRHQPTPRSNSRVFGIFPGAGGFNLSVI